jgi:UDP-glucose 4-epimerase
LGPPLIQLLANNGYHIRILDLFAPKSGILPKEIEILIGDINDRAILKEATSGIDLVFHLAAKLHINDPSPEMNLEFERVNVQGTRILAEAARDSGVKRLIFFSSICVYGSTPDNLVVDEKSDVNPETIYAKTKVEGEKIVLNTVPSVVLRLGSVYGPGMKGNYPRLISTINKGLYVPIGSGKNHRTLIFIEDIARAALMAAEHPYASGKVYNVTDGQVHQMNNITKSIYISLKKKPPKMHMPIAPLSLICGFLEDTAKLMGRDSPINRSTIHKITENVAVSGEKFQREIGFKPKYDLLSGWSKTVGSIMQKRTNKSHFEAMKQ